MYLYCCAFLKRPEKLLGSKNGLVKPQQNLSGVSQSTRKIIEPEKYAIFSHKLYRYSLPREKRFRVSFLIRN